MLYISVSIRQSISVTNGAVLHALGDDLACHSSNLVEIGIPKLNSGLNLEPSQADKEAIDNARSMIVTASKPGSCNYIVRDDSTVWVCQDIRLHFAGDNLLDLIFESKSNLGNFL